jgi:hypothetical protein
MAEKTAEKAQKMVSDLLLAGFSGVKIAEGSGVNQFTISAIKLGKQSRITEKVYDKIWNFWDENLPSKEKMEELRKNEAAAPKAKPQTKRKYTKKAKLDKAGIDSFINKNFVPVDVNAFESMIDRLILQYDDVLNELKSIKRQIQ